MRTFPAGLPFAVFLALEAGPTRAAVHYPLVLTLDARIEAGVTTITSKVTIRVDGPMDDRARARVTDGLKYGGYPAFVSALQPQPVLGSVETQSAKVEIRYAREEQAGAGSRLILVADRPLFFLSDDPSKNRTGYQLTIVDLRFDESGGVTGQMAGAARVKPGPDGAVVLDDYAETLVQLTGRTSTP